MSYSLARPQLGCTQHSHSKAAAPPVPLPSWQHAPSLASQTVPVQPLLNLPIQPATCSLQRSSRQLSRCQAVTAKRGSKGDGEFCSLCRDVILPLFSRTRPTAVPCAAAPAACGQHALAALTHPPFSTASHDPPQPAKQQLCFCLLRKLCLQTLKKPTRYSMRQ